MKDLKYSSVVLKKRDGYFDVFIYYSRHGELYYGQTMLKVPSQFVIAAKGRKKPAQISTRFPEFDSYKSIITKIHDETEDLIVEYVQKYKEKPKVSWLSYEVENKKTRVQLDLSNILCFWEQFIAFKKTRIRSYKTIDRINAVKHTLDQFSERRNVKLPFTMLEQPFFNDLVSYLAKEHTHYRTRNKRGVIQSYVVPTIGLQNKVIIKRLKDMSDYLRWVGRTYRVGPHPDTLNDMIAVAKHVNQVYAGSKKWRLTINPDEIQFVINLDYYEPAYWLSLTLNQRRHLHILVFMCLQGTAPVDTQRIRRTDIHNGIITMERSKSNEEFNVELDPVSEQILDYYKYDLRYTKQTMNDDLKTMFITIFALYRRHFNANNSFPYNILALQKTKKGSSEEIELKQLGCFAEAYTGRRSFGTNTSKQKKVLFLVETAERMGHSRQKPGTTLGYIYDDQQYKPRESLFGVYRILPTFREKIEIRPEHLHGLVNGRNGQTFNIPDEPWQLTLSADEIHFIINLDFYEPDYWKSLEGNHKRYIHLAVFMCLQGVGPGDMQKISNANIVGETIIQDMSMSDWGFNGSLNPISRLILNHYNNDLRFNWEGMVETIKLVFATVFELYKPYYEMHYGRPYELICTNRPDGRKDQELKMAHRALFIENVTFRRSFLRNQETGSKLAVFKNEQVVELKCRQTTKIKPAQAFASHHEEDSKRTFGTFRVLPTIDG